MNNLEYAGIGISILAVWHFFWTALDIDPADAIRALANRPNGDVT